jgi:hypothetical protein
MKAKIPSPIEYVHLQWDGPKAWQEKAKLKSTKDYGIYQIYGCHPVHGADCLLYIGKACDQPFAVRLKQEVDWMYDADFGRLSIYVGRCSGWDGTPSDQVWTRQIDLSEKLLILAHRPGWNAQKNIDWESKSCPACTSLTGGATAAFCPRSLVCATRLFSMMKRITSHLRCPRSSIKSPLFSRLTQPEDFG